MTRTLSLASVLLLTPGLWISLADAQVSCQHIGNQTFCRTFGSNGTSCQRIGNMLFCN